VELNYFHRKILYNGLVVVNLSKSKIKEHMYG